MQRVVVIHYDAAEGRMLAERIRRADFEAEVYAARGAAGLTALRAAPPDAVAIDLTRMPSYGRALGSLLREHKATRSIPLVFIEGDPDKTALVRQLLPDAGFTTAPKIGQALRKAIVNAPTDPVAPNAARLPLIGKLCIRDGSAVVLLHPPEGFLETLGPLPKDARFVARAADAETILLFAKSAAALGRELPALARDMRRGRTLWVMWPKRASAVRSDLTPARIVEMCSPLGLAGYKTCAVDEIWSGMAIAPPRSRESYKILTS